MPVYERPGRPKPYLVQFTDEKGKRRAEAIDQGHDDPMRYRRKPRRIQLNKGHPCTSSVVHKT